MKQRLANILFWSVISAAFIGPGTVTTAASAGAGLGSLLFGIGLFCAGISSALTAALAASITAQNL